MEVEKRQASRRPNTARHSDRLRKDYASEQHDLTRSVTSIPHLPFLKLPLTSSAINCVCIVVWLLLLSNPEISIPIRVLRRRSRNSVIARRARLSAVLPLIFPVAFLSSGSASFHLILLGIGCPSGNTGQFRSCPLRLVSQPARCSAVSLDTVRLASPMLSLFFQLLILLMINRNLTVFQLQIATCRKWRRNHLQ